jgi:glycosyltransferase involved in cell wall biosynthesis
LNRKLSVVRLLPVMDFGGAESRVVLQSAMIDRDRFDFRVCTFWKAGEAARRIREQGIPVDVLDVDPSVRNPRATLALVRYLRRVRPDILHASISEGIFHGAIGGALARVPCRIVEEVGIPSRSPLGQRMFGAAYHLAHAVVAVAQATADIILDEGAPPDRLHLIYNCAAPEFFGEPRHRREPSDRPLRILAVGRLVEVKNHANLLRAFRKAVDEAPGMTLRIAGEGPLRDAMQKQIARLDLGDHVELLGFRDDVQDLLYDSDVFVLPSWTEGCSISLVESMATGICVVGSTADGIREVMGELGEEWLIPPDDVDGWADAFGRLNSMTPQARVELGERAQQIAYDRFSPTVYNRNVTSLYLQLAEQRLA